MADYTLPADAETNPFVSRGMRRRDALRNREVTGTVDAVDPFAGNWAGQTARGVSIGLGNDLTRGTEYLARGLAGRAVSGRGSAVARR